MAVTTITFKNISNELTQAAILELLNGFKLAKNVSPVLNPISAGVPDYEITNCTRKIETTDDSKPVFYNPESAYAADNMPTLVKGADGKFGISLKIPVYQREQYISLLPGESISIKADDAKDDYALIIKFYKDVTAAFKSIGFGEKVVNVVGLPA